MCGIAVLYNLTDSVRKGLSRERIAIAQNKSNGATTKKILGQFECEIILFIFFLLRFIFKNLHGISAYFTSNPIFNIPVWASIATGFFVLLSVLALMSFGLGKFIKSFPLDFRNPLIYIVALFLACPASLPFLFSTESADGTQLLYPFALFIVSLSIARIPIIRWLLPFLCATFLVPSIYSSDNLFLFLRKGAILYIPLIMLYLYLNMITPHLLDDKKFTHADIKSPHSILFFLSVLSSFGSYMHILISDKPFYENAYYSSQPLDRHFIVSLLIAAPAVVTAAAVLRTALKNKFPYHLFATFSYSPFFLLLFFRGNYTGLWVPFVLLSAYMLVFFTVRLQNRAMLSAVGTVASYYETHRVLFFVLLITTASLLDTSAPYMANAVKDLFRAVPY